MSAKPDTVPTTFALMDEAQLDPNQIDVLFELRFVSRTDPSRMTITLRERNREFRA